MQFLLFTLLAAMVAIGVQRMSREGQIKRGSFTKAKSPPKEVPSAQEMTQCPVCKTYVIKNAGVCPNCSGHPPTAA